MNLLRDRTDHTYADASFAKIGGACASMFLGLVDGGMKRNEAVEVVKAYIQALALRPATPETTEGVE